MSQTMENPFAVQPRRRPARLWSGLKGLAMVAGLFAVLILAQAQSRRWLLESWVTGFADLPVAQQVERLLQINALGDIAIETVARRLAAGDETVAATAYELLRDHQSEWSSRDDAALGRAHTNMIRGINAVAAELDAQRTRWAIELINQSLLECVDRSIRETDDAYREANRLLAVLSPPALETGVALASATTNSATSDVDPTTYPRLVPLPVRVQAISEETEPIPVTSLTLLDSPSLESPPTTAQPVATMATPVPSQGEISASNRVPTLSPTVVALQPLRQLSQSSLESFDTKSVIGLLGSEQADLRDQAVDELVRRGLSNEEIRVANQLASPIVDVRIGLLESIANRTDIDPRPWLLWLAEDSNREVRLRAISSLATMNDSAVKQNLRKRLPNEQDPIVIAHLRRVVDVR